MSPCELNFQYSSRLKLAGRSLVYMNVGKINYVIEELK